MKKLFLIFGMCAATTILTAQDTIRFTWKGGVNKQYGLWAYGKGTFDWGDGTITKTGDGSGHTYADTNDYVVTIALDYEGSYGYINKFDCSSCQLSRLYIKSSDLRVLDCRNNQLPLSDLYAASLLISGAANRLLGTQRLPARKAIVGDTIDFSDQAIINYRNTDFTVLKSGTFAIKDVDYTINNGKIVFNFVDTAYMIIMSNSIITSHPSYPATVIVDINVRECNTDANLASLTVSKGKLSPDFHTDTLNYFVEVEYSVTDINISAKARDTNAIVSGHLGIQPLDTGNNVFIINVIAEDNITMQNYYVIVNRKDTVIDTTNIVEIVQENIRVYPNPTTSGQLWVEIAGQARNDGVDVAIFDVVGRNVGAYRIRPENDESTIDISHLANGMYFININNRVIKVVKN